MKRVLYLIYCILIITGILAEPAFARKKHALPEWEWGLRASLATSHNTNILGLSAGDRSVFLQQPYAFPIPLKSVDDVETEFEIRPELRWRAPLNLMGTLEYRFKLTHRIRNSFTDYQTHALTGTIRPRISGYRWQFRFRLSTIPSYYLRVYRDRDFNNEYATARFTTWDYEGAFRYRPLSTVWIEAASVLGTDYYNRRFTEYDSQSQEYRIGGIWQPSFWDFVLSTFYTRRISDNIGRNQPGATINSPLDSAFIGDSEYGDASYNEDEFAGGISFGIPLSRSIPVKAATNLRYRRRVFPTSRPIELDPFHRGRLDRRSTLRFSLSAEITKKLEVEAFAVNDVRRSHSPHPTVPLVKNFVRNELGLIFSYSLP